MREDYIEAMDRMFPEGWICLYTCPDGQVRFSLYNPQQLAMFEAWRKAIEKTCPDRGGNGFPIA